ncbi:MAG: hypothetical protein WCN95_14850, partial [bacterium]
MKTLVAAAYAVMVGTWVMGTAMGANEDSIPVTRRLRLQVLRTLPLPVIDKNTTAPRRPLGSDNLLA